MGILCLLVGGSGVGKTFIIDKMLEAFPDLRRVKTLTTRKPRNDKDHESYRFVTKDEFDKEYSAGAIVERDAFRGEFYGTSRKEIERILCSHSGIMAITPLGAIALSHEFQTKIFLLKPDNIRMYEKNLRGRGIDPHEICRIIAEERRYFVLPRSVRHTVVKMKRTRQDIIRFIELLSPAILEPQ